MIVERLAQGEDDVADSFRSRLWVLMLPDANDGPTSRSQEAVRLTVAVSVPSKLRSPEIAVDDRKYAMLRAAMPETAVDEYGDPMPREHHVGGSPDLREGANTDPKAKAQAVRG